VCSNKPLLFTVKSKQTVIFTVVFRGVSIQTAIGLGVQESLGRKEFWGA
jgi:hypothetical protein